MNGRRGDKETEAVLTAAKKCADKKRDMCGPYSTREEVWGCSHDAFYAGAKFMAKLMREASNARR